MNAEDVCILVVDDELHNREIIAEYLDDANYQLCMAEDGECAWQMLQDKPELYDLVLLDIMMPKMDGLTLLRLIREHSLLEQVPVILQTARGGNQDIVAGFEAGAFYYLTKPYDEALLCSVLSTALNDRRRYLQLKTELNHSLCTFGMMQCGTFRFKSLSQGKMLIQILAQVCPNPEKAVLGLSELLINAVEHGNLAIDYALKTKLMAEDRWQQEVDQRLNSETYRDRFVQVEFERDFEQLRFTVTDQGEGFNWKPYLCMDPARGSDNHGRGIAMAGLISFDKIEYLGKGNKVIARINL